MFRLLEGRKFIEEDLHDGLFKTLQDIYDGNIKRQNINLPPRSAKTTTAKYFIAYCLAKNSKCNFIYTSFSQSLLKDISRELASILQNPKYQAMYSNSAEEISLEIDPINEFWKDYLEETQGKTMFSSTKIITKEGGIILFASIGSAITGFGAGIRGAKVFSGGLFIDDANKPVDIHSQVMRDKVKQYFEETLLSRVNDSNIPIINIQQRLHMEDLSGFLIELYNFLTLKCPLIIDGICQLPSQYSVERIEEIKKNDFMFSAQYQQEPIPIQGNIFKKIWLNYYDKLPKLQYRCIYADTAVKDGKQNDYSVFECWGYGEDNKAYLIDQIRGKWLLPELLEKAKMFWKKHYDQKELGNIRRFAIEDKSSGSGLIQLLRNMTNMPITLLKPEKDKVLRAEDATPRFESEQVILPRHTHWLSEYLAELLAFPNGKHDDQVDTTTYAINDLFARNVITNTGFSI